MKIYIDNNNIEDYFNVKCLDYTQALSFASERENKLEWEDKSGIDKNLTNIRYDAKEFTMSFLCKATTILQAHTIVNTLVTYLFEKGVVVLSIRDEENNIRKSFPVQRSGVISPDINIREQNSLYVFKLGLMDINPNALIYQTTITDNEASIYYSKGQTAVIYWGDGTRDIVSNSGTYIKDDYAADGIVDIIIDIDKDAEDIDPLISDFTADITSGIKPETIQFTDLSVGSIDIWSWDFGDGGTSDEQNPEHTYTESGTFTVALQIFNSARGDSVTIKTDYIVIRDARLLINDTDTFLINDSGNYLLKN